MVRRPPFPSVVWRQKGLPASVFTIRGSRPEAWPPQHARVGKAVCAKEVTPPRHGRLGDGLVAQVLVHRWALSRPLQYTRANKALRDGQLARVMDSFRPTLTSLHSDRGFLTNKAIQTRSKKNDSFYHHDD